MAYGGRKNKINLGAKLYEDFTGHEPEDLGTVEILDPPDVAVLIGEVEGIIYNTVRDGVFERYIHKFKAKARPSFCVSPDGKQLLLVGGNFTFTERGIVDE
jgi:hypothetical protein